MNTNKKWDLLPGVKQGLQDMLKIDEKNEEVKKYYIINKKVC